MSNFHPILQIYLIIKNILQYFSFGTFHVMWMCVNFATHLNPSSYVHSTSFLNSTHCTFYDNSKWQMYRHVCHLLKKYIKNINSSSNKNKKNKKISASQSAQTKLKCAPWVIKILQLKLSSQNGHGTPSDPPKTEEKKTKPNEIAFLLSALAAQLLPISRRRWRRTRVILATSSWK